ncbi:MAG: CPBP family intramembrane metalloprotease [Chitinophagaceae bacterium]|nr:CPBP family intramembrane metalloprotease [Chitinophagaceae bacterium]
MTYDSRPKGLSYSAGFFMLIAFAIAGIIFSAEIAKMVWISMTGKNFDQYIKGMADPAYSTVYKIMQLVSMLGFFIPAIVVAWLINRQPFTLLGFSSHATLKQAGLVCLITAAAIFVGGALSYVNHLIPVPADWRVTFDKAENDYNRQVYAILGLKSMTDYVLALVIMAFLPALCEETLFRGGLQNFLTRSTGKPWLAIIIVSTIFSLAHFSFYGFLFRFLLGIVLGWLYYYSGRLWLSILAHFINNALAITVFYYYTRQGKALDVIKEDTGSSAWGFLAVPALIGLFMLFRKESAEVKAIY